LAALASRLIQSTADEGVSNFRNSDPRPRAALQRCPLFSRRGSFAQAYPATDYVEHNRAGAGGAVRGTHMPPEESFSVAVPKVRVHLPPAV